MSARARPILFSGAMVRSILYGEKSQTRRVVKPQPFEKRADYVTYSRAASRREAGTSAVAGDPSQRWWQDGMARMCPYGNVGDRLWVRETWRSWDYNCENAFILEDDHEHDEHCHQTYVAYAATPRSGFRSKPDRARITYLDEHTPIEYHGKLEGPWRPSIHMPRWASRITLEITDVRVERLQSISEADAIAEGIANEVTSDGRKHGFRWADGQYAGSAIHGFELLWQSINAKRAPWDSNPWVWVISFKRIETRSAPHGE